MYILAASSFLLSVSCVFVLCRCGQQSEDEGVPYAKMDNGPTYGTESVTDNTTKSSSL